MSVPDHRAYPTATAVGTDLLPTSDPFRDVAVQRQRQRPSQGWPNPETYSETRCPTPANPTRTRRTMPDAAEKF